MTSFAESGEPATRAGAAAANATDGPPAAPAWVGDLSLVPHWIEHDGADVEPWPSAADSVAIVACSAAEASAWAEPFAQARVFVMSPDDRIEDWRTRFGDDAAGAFSHVFWILPDRAAFASGELAGDATSIGGQEDPAGLVTGGFRLVKGLLAAGHGKRRLGLTVVTRQAQAISPADDVDPAQASVHGLISSLSREQPAWDCRLVDLPHSAPHRVEAVRRRAALPNGAAAAWRHGAWHVQKLLPCTLPEPRTAAYRDDGVYVILGGAGGLGGVLTRHLAARHRAQVVWVGRRALDASISAKIAASAAHGGPAPCYFSADATDPAALAAVREAVLARYGAIHGVVHATIVLEDKPLERMDEATFSRVLDAKVRTGSAVAEVFGRGALDWILFFSSLQSIAKAAGQANYAAGCTFIDALALRMRQAGNAAKVVNWGYWGSDGIVATPFYRQLMALVGLDSIDPDRALSVVERLLVAPVDQVIHVKTTRPTLLPELGALVSPTFFAVADRVGMDATGRVAAAPDAPLPAAVRRSAEQSAQVGRLLPGLLAVQLRAAGVLAAAGPADVLQGQPAYLRKWLAESLSILARHGHVSASADGWTMSDAQWAAVAHRWDDWARFKAGLQGDAASGQAEVVLVETTLAAVPDILQGRVPAASVLFPRGSMSLVESIYRDNPVADHFNTVLGDRLLSFIDATAPGSRLRILEIGAGTGGTSAELFKRLADRADRIEEYAYTDLSQLFLMHAKERFGADIPYLKRRIFNVEKALAPQRYTPGTYDVVIAANVLHATTRIRESLRNAKALLKQGGVLLLNELATHKVSMHVSFGLLEGWWLSEDLGMRTPGCPVLDASQWARALAAEGFERVGIATGEPELLGQQVIEAYSDGWVSQAGVPRLDA